MTTTMASPDELRSSKVEHHPEAPLPPLPTRSDDEENT